MSASAALGDVYIAPTAVEYLRRCAQASHPIETGGVLLGYRRAGAVLVVSAEEIRDPKSTRHSYVTDERAIQEVLDRLDPADGIGYVGPWHAHPRDLGHSFQDRCSLRRIAKLYEHPIASIVLRRTADGYDLEARVAIDRSVRKGNLIVQAVPKFPRVGRHQEKRQ